MNIYSHKPVEGWREQFDKNLADFEFPSGLSQQLCKEIISGTQDISHLVESISVLSQESIFTEQEKNSGLNLLGIAIERENFEALTIIIRSVSFDVLRKIVTQKDSSGKSFYHRFIPKIYKSIKEYELNRFSLAYFQEPPKPLPKEFRETEFQIPLAQLISEAVHLGEDQKLEQLIKNSSCVEINNSLREQDKKNSINLLAFAAHLNNANAVNIISANISSLLLKEILLQTDKQGWTAFHHLAIMNDHGACYRNMKIKTNINTKIITKFYCESPSMLRKYIRLDHKKIPSLTKEEKKKFKIYFREGMQRNEHHFVFEEFKKKFGDFLTKVPIDFRFIPYATCSYFREYWTNARKITKNECELNEIDLHIRAIYNEGEEKGLALATMEQADNGELLPIHHNLGLGVEARCDFAKGQLVTLFAGEHTGTNLNYDGHNHYMYWGCQKICVNKLEG